MRGHITGTGSFAPEYRMDNNEIATFVETSDEWIQERTGVASRHIIKEETTVSMAAKAAQEAIKDAGIAPTDIDLLIVSTISSNVILPSAACAVQGEIGADNAVCFDLNAACTGFVFAYQMAQNSIAAGMSRCALVIGAESLSNLLNWTDRGSCILFGDGAGAAILQAEDGDGYLGALHSDGSRGNVLTCESRNQAKWTKEDILNPETFLQMDGQGVFKFAVKQVPISIEEVLEKNQMEKEDIDYYILHQANKRIVESVAKRLKQPIEKFPMNLQEYGNTSSASIPILLDELNKNGTLKTGQKIIISGFGAGLTWGSCIVEF